MQGGWPVAIFCPLGYPMPLFLGDTPGGFTFQLGIEIQRKESDLKVSVQALSQKEELRAQWVIVHWLNLGFEFQHRDDSLVSCQEVGKMVYHK